MKKKINNLDAYRVIVTLLIVIGHSMYLNITQTTGGVSYTLNTLTSPVYYNTFFTLFNYLIILISKVHIQLFFVLSGILIYKVLEKYSIDEYIINRFKRLIIPYLLCGLLYMIPIKSLTGFYSDIFLSYKSFLSGFDGGHLWFLPALFWMSIILFIIAKKLTSKNSYFVLIICILIQFFLKIYQVNYSI